MLDRSKKGLLIFESFNVDYKLPKHNKDNSNSINPYDINMDGGTMSIGGSVDVFVSPSEIDSSPNLKLSLFKRFIQFLSNLFNPEKKPKLTVGDFFKSVKGSAIDVNKYSDRVNTYISALEHAKKNNQTALVQELESKKHQAM